MQRLSRDPNGGTRRDPDEPEAFTCSLLWTLFMNDSG
jgi:hypothetical protein